MKLGIRYSDTQLDDIVAIAQAAEPVGLELLWRGEHVLTPRVIRSIDPYYARALPPGMERFPSLDPVTLAAFLAARTERLRFSMGVNILPLHVPYQLARTIATADIVSGGRTMMAVGVGWLREEFDILGVDWVTRGRRTDESMAVLRTLWGDAHPEFHGEHFTLPLVTFQPKPVQKGGPPIFVAGLSTFAIRRAARHGDGWYGHDLSVPEAAAVITRIEAARAEHRTADRPFQYTTRAPWDVTLETVQSFSACGVDRLVLDVRSASVHGLKTVVGRFGTDRTGPGGERVDAATPTATDERTREHPSTSPTPTRALPWPGAAAPLRPRTGRMPLGCSSTSSCLKPVRRPSTVTDTVRRDGRHRGRHRRAGGMGALRLLGGHAREDR